MQILALLAPLLLAQTPLELPSGAAPLAHATRRPAGAVIFPDALASLRDTVDLADDITLGGAPDLPGAGPALVTVEVGNGNILAVTIERTGTGFKESLQVLVPFDLQADPVPLLVAFHRFGNTAQDILNNTSFLREAQARGWFVVAPLGATKKSFSSIQSQICTELALQWVFLTFGSSIDRERIYGVGHSMGGGSCLNYAARHLDPAQPMFAALVNHTGTTALKDVYKKEADGTPCTDPEPVKVHCILKYWFGGTPAEAPFLYERSSLIDFLPGSGLVLPGTDLARNLTHVPVRNVYAIQDPLKYLVKQTQVFHGHLTAIGGSSELLALPGNKHTWDLLDETVALDWLEQFRLELPAAAATLADRDARYFSFDVEQDAPGSFTPFTWSAEPAANRLVVLDTANLRRISVDPESLSLSPGATLTVETGAADGTGDEIRLFGYPEAPAGVLRDGSRTADWVFDGRLGSVLLLELDGTKPHLWEVIP